MPRGGYRPGGGRPKGSTNRATKAAPDARVQRKRSPKSESVAAPASEQPTMALDASQFDTALDFLKAVRRGQIVATDVQMRAAALELPYTSQRLPEATLGKKATAQEAAQDVVATGRFAPSAPPKLAVDNTKRRT
jgi:phage terminase small subunit